MDDQTATEPTAEPPVVGVVGAGTMGAGIAQLAVEHGHETWLHDPDPAAVERARARIASGLERRAAKFGIDGEAAQAWTASRLDRLRTALTPFELADPSDVVIEAALEDLEVKQQLFRRLDLWTRADAILATNTSALSIAEIAVAVGRPDRLLGLHFFNPAPVMPLVEVVAGPATSPEALAAATDLVTGWGKTAVRCADAPGFIVNRVNRPFTLEALAAVERGEATTTAIDAAARAAGFPMGPFALMDLVGIDVNLAAARGVHAGFLGRGDPLAERFRPSPIQERLVGAGRLGRKTGEGFYRYDADGRAIAPAADFEDRAAGEGAADASAAAVVERIRLAIDAEAWRALAEGVATAADIDVALRLGAAHPTGPFEHTGELGGPPELARRLAELTAAGHSERFAVPTGLEAATR